MRRLSALLTTLLVASLLSVLGTGTVEAKRPAKKNTAVSVRFAPDHVTTYASGMVEPTGVVVQVTPAKGGRAVTIQRQSGSSWVTATKRKTDATGRVYLPLTATATVRYRAVVAANTFYKPATSTTRTLTVTSNNSCGPVPVPIDGSATGEAKCLLARLDRWRSNGLMGVGQQVNISRFPDWDAPLEGIDAPAVVGFDLEELDQAATTEFPYDAANRTGLLERARAGAVLVATWHADNPFVPGQTFQSPPRNIGPLLTPGSAAYDRFWDDWDTMLDHLKRFEIGDGDGDGLGDGPGFNEYYTAVVVRPLHEPNGDFFWWGKQDPVKYRTLFSMMQDRASSWSDPHDLFPDGTSTGVHNIVWAYSGNRDTSTTRAPGDYVPWRIDIGGLDAYDPEFGTKNAPDAQPLEGYAGIEKNNGNKLTRMALTEVGPHGSKDGAWNPKVITRDVRQAKVAPLWAMLWFDDGSPTQANPSVGKKQIGSLTGGRAWLRSCYNALCYLR